MSDYLKWAAIAGEDRRFKDHGGVDVPSVIRAAVGQASGSDAGGASTLTMQTVRNILVQQALNQTNPDGTAVSDAKIKADIPKALAPTFDRKLKEMKLAIGLEKRYSKDEILQAYLNIAGFGGNTYGVQAASLQYFSKNAADLTLAESASLLAIVQYPTQRDLQSEDHYAANQNRRDVILNAMYAEGYITKAERDEAIATPVDADFVHPTPTTSGCLGADPVLRVRLRLRRPQHQRGRVARHHARRAPRGVQARRLHDRHLDQPGRCSRRVTEIVQAAAPEERDALPARRRRHLGPGQHRPHPGDDAEQGLQQHARGRRRRPRPRSTSTPTSPTAGRSGSSPDRRTSRTCCSPSSNSGGGLDEAFNASKLEVNQASLPRQLRRPVGRQVQVQERLRREGLVHGDARLPRARSTRSSCRWRARSTSARSSGSPSPSACTTPAARSSSSRPVLLHRWLREQHRAGDRRRRLRGDRQPGRLLRADHHRQRHRPRRRRSSRARRANCGQSAVSPAVANTAAYAMAGRVHRRYGEPRRTRSDGTTYIGKTGTTDNAVHVWLVGSSTAVSTAVWVGNIKGKQSLRQISVNGTQAALLRHVIFRPIAQAIDALLSRAARSPAPDPALLKGNPVIVPERARHDAGAGEGRDRTRRAQLRRGRRRSTPTCPPDGRGDEPRARVSRCRAAPTSWSTSSNGQAQAHPRCHRAARSTLRRTTPERRGLHQRGRAVRRPRHRRSDAARTRSTAMDPAAGIASSTRPTIITLHYYGPPCLRDPSRACGRDDPRGRRGRSASPRSRGASLVERNRFTVRHEVVPVLEPGARPLTILHLSDLHMAPWQTAQAGLRPLARALRARPRHRHRRQPRSRRRQQRRRARPRAVRRDPGRLRPRIERLPRPDLQEPAAVLRHDRGLPSRSRARPRHRRHGAVLRGPPRLARPQQHRPRDRDPRHPHRAVRHQRRTPRLGPARPARPAPSRRCARTSAGATAPATRC